MNIHWTRHATLWGTILFLTFSRLLSAAATPDLPGGGRADFPLGFFDLEMKTTQPEIVRPVLVTRVVPKYPQDAKKENVTGDVRIDTTIGTQGEVIDPKVVNEVDARLAQSALEAVKQWKFKPAEDGQGNKVKVTLTVRFALK